jgi:hypothetical protein
MDKLAYVFIALMKSVLVATTAQLRPLKDDREWMNKLAYVFIALMKFVLDATTAGSECNESRQLSCNHFAM